MSSKKILLMRHSIPERCELPTVLISLSKEGRVLAESLKELFVDIDKCFSSPYRRAFETTEILFGGQVIVKDQLHERLIGDAHEDFWLKQYQNYDYRNPGGESLNMVRVRMKLEIDDILQELADEKTALVVSHATAMCSYLLSFCEIVVSDAASKSRIIKYNNHEILRGKINPLDYFELEFENNSIKAITFRNMQ